MKIFLLRVGLLLVLVFFQLSFLNIIFPWFHVPLLLVVSVVAWTLIMGFPEALKLTLPLCLLYDIVSFGMISGFTLFAVVLAYATSFLSRRVVLDHYGVSIGLYAFFAAASALMYQLIAFVFLNGDVFFRTTNSALSIAAFPSDIFIFSFVLALGLFLILYVLLRRFDAYVKSMFQKKILKVR